jgi:hypothetical protein
MKIPTLVSSKFGRLTVVSRGPNNERGDAHWDCLCECGKSTTASGYNLRKGLTQSCGCLHKEKTSEASVRHGYLVKGSDATYVYHAYRNALRRCNTSSGQEYETYSARGITVEFSCFEEFAAELGPRPSPEHSVDRIDNSQGYKVGNIRWSTASMQMVNQRRRRNISGFLGVSPNRDRWKAVIAYENIKYHLGTFDTREEAARVYDLKAIELHGALARFNFPPKKLVSTAPDRAVSQAA